ncbi:DUF4365 domain-containing protein [Massilia kyonggiensis]|nr:DUF4365 domain-containing protein [Massilia kyonggiensis]
MNDELPGPKYSKTLQMEDRSLDILQYKRPENWIVRPLEKRDLGIDGEVELHADNQSQALFFKFQLKSRETITWNSSGQARSTQLGVASANYWLGVQRNQGLPVFLFDVDLSNEEVYFAALGPELRRNYGDLFIQKTVTVGLQKSHYLTNVGSEDIFAHQFQRELHLNKFVSRAESFLSGFTAKADFLLNVQGRDGHMEVDDEEKESRIAEIYQDTYELLESLHTQDDRCEISGIPEFDSYFLQCQREMGGGNHMLEYTITKLCEKLEQVFPIIATAIIERFIYEEGEYWERVERRLHAKCVSMEHVVHVYAKDVKRPRAERHQQFIHGRTR